jgi:hypothetical protein
MHGDQKLLALAGKDGERAFPDDPWQLSIVAAIACSTGVTLPFSVTSG